MSAASFVIAEYREESNDEMEKENLVKGQLH